MTDVHNDGIDELDTIAAWLVTQPRRVPQKVMAGTVGEGQTEPEIPDETVEEERPNFLINAPTAPMPVAHDLLMRWPHVRYADGHGIQRSIHWRGEWWDHVGSHYRMSSERSVENSLWRVLDEAEYTHVEEKDGEKKISRRRWEPTRTRVSNVVKGLEACCEVGDDIVENSWLTFPQEAWLTPYEDTERSDRLVALGNVMLDPASGQTFPHDERYLNTYALPFDYDAAAQCPQWEAYLASILGEDSVKLLQEWAGYVVSGRTDLQKMLFMVGPSRSGKGTIALILSALIGMINVAGPTMNNFTGQFGLQPLLGKPLAIFDDVRLPPKPDNVYTALERLLSVIGEAPLTVDRKNKEPITAKLPTRIMMSANQLLEFPDEVGAMQTRMLVLVFTQSFVGREKRDEEFKDLFLAELPGILNWAMAGLVRLNDNGGRFTQPADSDEISEELRDAGNPVRAFVREHCVLAPDQEVAELKKLRTVDERAEARMWMWADDLYGLYAESHGGFKDNTAQRSRFGRELKAAHPQVIRKRKRRDGVMAYYYEHIELSPEHQSKAEALRAEDEAVREARRWAKNL